MSIENTLRVSNRDLMLDGNETMELADFIVERSKQYEALTGMHSGFPGCERTVDPCTTVVIFSRYGHNDMEAYEVIVFMEDGYQDKRFVPTDFVFNMVDFEVRYRDAQKTLQSMIYGPYILSSN